MPKHNTKRSYRHLNQQDRDRLQALRDDEIRQKEIARILGVDPSTISREIARNRRKYRKKKRIKNKRASYEASVAHQKAYVRRLYARYQGKNINENTMLRRYIVQKLKRRWSPDAISGRMKKDHKSFYASKTAIYEWLRTIYGQRWCRYLYSRRHYTRKRKEKKAKKSLIPNRKGIAMRPKGATNRSRYGHYEGDTIVSAKKTASTVALFVLYERKAKYINARKIANLKPQSNNQALNAMQDEVVMKSVTMDNGIENTNNSFPRNPTSTITPMNIYKK